MSTPNNGPLGLTPPTPGRQEGDGWTDDNNKTKARANHKPYVCLSCGENYANPNPEPLDIPAYCPQCAPMHEAPDTPTICEWIGLISADGFNRISVLAYDEAQARAKVDLKLRKCNGLLWREWKNNGERVTVYELTNEPLPFADIASNLALDQWRAGIKHGISQVISYLSGRLGDDPLIEELQAHFEGGQDE